MNAVLRREPRMDSFGPCTVGQKLHRPGSHASRDPDGGEGLIGCQPEQFRRCNRRAKHTAGGRHMKTERVMFLGLHRHRDAGRGLISGHHCGEEGIGRSVGHGLGQRQRGGIHSCAQMNGAAAVRVVHFDGMLGCAIRQRREARNGPDASADHGGASIRAHTLDHPLHRCRRFLTRTTNRRTPDNRAGSSARDRVLPAGKSAAESGCRKLH